MDNVVGKLMCFKTKDDDQVVDCEVLVEVTECRKDGTIELAWNDRDERCYLNIPLDLVIAQALKKFATGE
jgi:hypothetical protein